MFLRAIIFLLVIIFLSINFIEESWSASGISYEFSLVNTSIAYKKGLTSISLSPNGNIIAGGSEDGNVKLWEAISGKEIKAIIRNPHPVACLEFAPDGNAVIVGLGSGDMVLWDINYKERIKTFKGHSARINSIKFSKDGGVLVSASNDKSVKIWDMKSGNEIRTLKHNDNVLSVDIEVDGKSVLSGSRDGSAILWDTDSGNELLKISADSVSINSVSISADGKSIATGSLGGMIKIWDAVSGEEKLVINGKSGGIVIGDGLKFSPDGNIIASATEKGFVVIYYLDSGAIISELKQHQGKANAILFSNDGKSLISAGEDGKVNIWRIKVTEILTVSLNAPYEGWQRGILNFDAEVVGNAQEVVFQYTQDGNAWNDIFVDSEPPYSVSWDTRGLVPSVIPNIRIRVIARKASGMSAMNISSKTFSIDNQAPTTSDDYDGLWHKKDFTINLSASDGEGNGLADTFYRINYGNRRNTKIDGQPRITTQGINTLEYWSVDRMGNEEEHKILTDVKLDKNPPVFSDWAKNPQVISKEYKGSFRVSLRVADINGSGLEGKIPQIKYKIGRNSNYSNYTDMISSDNIWYFDIPEPSGGWGAKFGEPLYYMVRCEDFAGNSGESVEQQEIIGSTDIPPTVKLTSKLRKWEGGKISLTAEPNDSDGTISNVKFSYSAGGDKWTEIGEIKEYPYTVVWDTKPVFPEIADGVRIQVNATDSDNLTARDISETFGIDNQPPTTNHDYDGRWRKSDFVINLTADDGSGSGISQIKYTINGGYERKVETDGQPKIDEHGESILEYWSVDAVGNEEEHKALTGINLDRFAPSAGNWEAKKDGMSIVINVLITDDHSGIDGNPEFDYHIGPNTQFGGYKSMTEKSGETWTYKVDIGDGDIGKMLYCKVSVKDKAGNLSIGSWQTLITDKPSEPILAKTESKDKESENIEYFVFPDDIESESVAEKKLSGEVSHIEWLQLPSGNIEPGTKLEFRGRVIADITTPEQIELTLVAPGDVAYVAQTYTNTKGEFTFNAPITEKGEWLLSVRWDGNEKYRGSTSDAIKIIAGSLEAKAESPKKEFNLFDNKKVIIIGVLALYLLIIGVSR